MIDTALPAKGDYDALVKNSRPCSRMAKKTIALRIQKLSFNFKLLQNIVDKRIKKETWTRARLTILP